MKFKKGQEITLVSKGIQRSEYGKPWIDYHRKGTTSFLIVTRVGRKYVYGNYIFYDPDEGRKVRDWEDSFLMEDYVILNGVRLDIKAKHRQFERDVEARDKARREFRREKERQANDWVSKQMDMWDAENPSIKNDMGGIE